MLKYNLLFKEGKLLIVGAAVALVLAYYFFPPLMILPAVFLLFCLYFFRNPERHCLETEKDRGILIAPSDGKVMSIEAIDEQGFQKKIAIFLSPLDVHVNWLPMAGSITSVCYKKGQFLCAFKPKSSLYNERNDIVIEQGSRKILVRQIAGAVARRIVCWVKPQESYQAGSKYGMIKFSSRVELFLPNQVELLVKEGDYIYGGQTPIGRWRNTND